MKHMLSGKKKLILGLIGAVFVCILFVPSLVVNRTTRDDRFASEQISQLEPGRVAIVFGAGVFSDGTPTPYLQNRLATAVELYEAGKVDAILLSGDNGEEHYNEPVAMQRYIVGLGLPAEVTALDYAGFSTYDTCYRAREIFGVRQAYLVSQGYHLPRAVMTCQSLGIDAQGIAAQKRSRDYTLSYLFRELLSTNKAVLDVAGKPQPELLGNQEITPVLQ